MPPAPRRIRIGIDTGGTFTDVVAFDEDTGELVTTKTPSTPGRPGRRVHGRDRQGARPARPAAGQRRRGHARSATAPRSPPTSCSRARSTALGFITTDGLRGDARDRPAVRARRLRQLLLLGQAAPDRAARPGARASAAGSTSPAPRCGPSTRTAPARSRAGSGRRASTPSGSASCTPTPTPTTRSGCARSCARSTPTRSSRCRSEVLREYREYERAMTTLVDAAVKPRLRGYVTNIKAPARRRTPATARSRST